MNLDVHLQVSQSRKCFIAHLTFNAMFLGFMQGQLLFTGIYFVTVAAFVSRRICVHIPDVFFVLTGKAERLVTEVALVWLPTCMQS